MPPLPKPADVEERLRTAALKVKEQVVKTPGQEWGVMIGLSFFLCLVYSGLFRAKDASLLNLGVIFYALVLALVSVAIRATTVEHYYPYSVLLLTVLGVVYPLSNFSNLVLGAVPVAINVLRAALLKENSPA